MIEEVDNLQKLNCMDGVKEEGKKLGKRRN